MTVERILFVINRSSATGYGHVTINRLRSILLDAVGQGTAVHVAVVVDHQQAKEQTKAFLNTSKGPRRTGLQGPALVIAGGGGGTLRAVVEAVCDGTTPGRLPGRDRIRIAALRMGSGNIVAKQFGVPFDPEAGLKGIIANCEEDRTTSCCIIRCEVGIRDCSPTIYHATALAGFGQFGRSPGDLARWHRRVPTLRKLIARFTGIEPLNTIEYGLSLLSRCACIAFRRNAAEIVEVHANGCIRSMRLLGGTVMNFVLRPMPFRPDIRVEEEALTLFLIPYPGRWASLMMIRPRRFAKYARYIRISKSDAVTILLIDRDAVEFFLDEDPLVFYRRVCIQVAGTLAFVPGPDYRWLNEGQAPS